MVLDSDKLSLKGKSLEQIEPGPVSNEVRTFRRALFVYKGMEYVREIRNPGVAAVLSFFIPGVGQIYNGKIFRGIFWLIVTPGIWWFTGGLFGWACHLLSAYTAYHYAKNHPY